MTRRMNRPLVFLALVSFRYNTGGGEQRTDKYGTKARATYRIMNAYKKGDWSYFVENIKYYGGKDAAPAVKAALKERRDAETYLFFDGIYLNNA